MTVLSQLVTTVDALAAGGRVLVAIDGPDAAGKTTLADRLAAALATPTVRASVDGFHRPRADRIRVGDISPEGYYRDSFDLPRFERLLLQPFAEGAATVTTSAFDHRTDHPCTRSAQVPRTGVLVVDGVFLLRPELHHWWTFAVHLDVPDEVTIGRVRGRDAAELGGPEAVEQRYRARYLPGQALYRQEARPQEHAHVVLDNTDPADPRVIRWSPTAAPSGWPRPGG